MSMIRKFITAYGNLFNIFLPVKNYNDFIPSDDDFDNIKKDFDVVGNEIKLAMQKFKKENIDENN